MSDRQPKAKLMTPLKSAILGAALATGLALASTGIARAGEAEEMLPDRQHWSFAGVFGTYDQGQLQRGFKIYQQVCSNCHALSMIAFRNLADKGGPSFSPEQVKALAATYKVKDLNDAGEIVERNARPSDYFPWNYANPTAAAATLGVAPPDMSLLAKARSYERGFPMFVFDMLPFTAYQEKGPDYIYALLVKGYTEPPKDFIVAEGSYYNAIYPGHNIHMANPLNLLFDEKTDKPSDATFYEDGTPFTRQQAARDITAFLMWTAEPKLEERKKTGFRVMIFLAIFAALLFFVKRRVWAGIAH